VRWATDPRPDLAPFDHVRFWRAIRRRPDGVAEVPMAASGRLGARRIVRLRGLGPVLRVHCGESIEYVPIDAARREDPNQLSIDVG
jgi:hypothetical protein